MSQKGSEAKAEGTPSLASALAFPAHRSPLSEEAWSADVSKEQSDVLWSKCEACSEFVFKLTLERNAYTCPHCGHYSTMPAKERLLYLFDAEVRVNLHPTEIDPTLLKAIGMSDIVLPHDDDFHAIAAGEGTIMDWPAILAVIGASGGSCYGRFVSLLAATRIAAHRKLPLITVYPATAQPRRTSADTDRLAAQMAFLSLEMEKLAKMRLPQITILTDAHPVMGFSTSLPLGDIVLAEKAQNNRGHAPTPQHVVRQNAPRGPQSDVIIDHFVSRQNLPEMLGKLLVFCGK